MTRGYRPLAKAAQVSPPTLDRAEPGADHRDPRVRQPQGRARSCSRSTRPADPRCPASSRPRAARTSRAGRPSSRASGEAPGWVIADLDPGGRPGGVRETWPASGRIPLAPPSSPSCYARLAHARTASPRAGLARNADPPLSRGRYPWAPNEPLPAAMAITRSMPRSRHARADPPTGSSFLARGRDVRAARSGSPSAGWIATNELLIGRQWRLEARWRAEHSTFLPRSTGAGSRARIGEWLSPLRRRAGRWQNVRRLNLVLGADDPARPWSGPRGQVRRGSFTRTLRRDPGERSRRPDPARQSPRGR